MEQIKDIGILIKVIHDKIGAKANERLRVYDLTIAQVRVLRRLSEAGGLLSLKALETFFRVKHPTMIGILRRLEAKEFVAIEINAQDKRLRDVHLLPKGTALNAKMYALLKEDEARLTAGFTPDETETLRALLLHAYRNLGDTP